MKSVNLIVLAVVLSATLASAFYSKSSGITDLNKDNFRQLVKKGNRNLPWFVEFYAPWCGHCKNLKPEYIKLASKLKGIANIGAVDCDNKNNQPLAQQYGIQGFPTLKLITPSGKIVDYNGARTAGAMASFVIQHIPNNVRQVNDGSFDTFKNVMPELPRVLLFTDKTKTTPLYQSLSAQFSQNLVFGEVRKPSATQLISNYGVTTFPTILIFRPDVESPITYDGAMNSNSIREFLALHAGEPVEVPQDEQPKKSNPPKSRNRKDTKEYGIQLSESNFDQLVTYGNQPWMVEFFAPWCGHCQQLAPEWKKAANSLKGMVKFGTVDCTVEKGLASRFEIDGYPTIKVFYPGEKKSRIHDYTGGRSAKALSDFAATTVPDIVTKLTLQSMQGWVSGDEKKVILVSNKDTTPLLLKAAALEFKDRLKFGALLSSTQQVLDGIIGEAGKLKVPSLLISHPSDSGMGIEAYTGPLSYDLIVEFLSKHAPEKENPDSSFSASSELEVHHVSNQASFDEKCGEKLGICVIAFPPQEEEGKLWSEMESFQVFANIAKRSSSRPFHFMWMDPVEQRHFADFLRIPEDGSIGVVALNPRRKRYSVFVGAYDEDGMIEFLENLLRGKIVTSSYTELPKLADTILKTSASDETQCESADTNEGQCSMPTPKDEL